MTQRILEATNDPARRLAIANAVLDALDGADDPVLDPARQLHAIAPRAVPGAPPPLTLVRPSTPLSDAALLTNSPSEPNLGAELRSELDSCDRADLLCAFVKWHGLRLLEPELKRLRQRSGPLRVITTTYMGATDADALDRLVRDFGAEVKIHYDTQRTRLHAKAWLFHRRTGFDTAYVGSSNLSRAALLDGVEWNVRLSRVATPTLLTKFEATFDTYWNDPSFERYDPDHDRDRLDDGLAEASGRSAHSRITISLSGLEVRPFPHQQTILDQLTAEREVHDRHRNLVVAATGTGKTVIAAFDYRHLARARPEQPSLLFVAHRKELLEQAMKTYREVLNDANFGELYAGGARPERWRHVFASVQSLSSYGVSKLPPQTYDVVVIDEFHHAEAPTYRRLIEHLTPHELLGLTATPERTDGLDVRSFFDGRTAAELRLWDALGADLLCPFHYFAVADGTDLRRISWSRGRYDDGELAGLYTGNRSRAAIVLAQLRDKVTDLAVMRGLGFCVSVAHAQFMADVFNEAGVAAAAVSGGTAPNARQQALDDLRAGRLKILFAADLFNEGVDLPDVDTILFLRPTESATLFLQQLGRGLRRTATKPVLTVLDFVGHQRKEFRFDRRLRALTGQTRRAILHDIERGFPFLPSGCQIVMDETAQRVVVENLRAQVTHGWRDAVVELRASGDVSLTTFLHDSGLELPDVLKRDKSWTALRRAADLPTRSGAEQEKTLLKRVRALAHVDDPDRAVVYRRLLADDAPAYASLSMGEQHLARMLFFSLWPTAGGHSSIESGLAQLRHESAVRDELVQVIDFAFDRAPHVTVQLPGHGPDLPLRIHAAYQREEILTALGHARLDLAPSTFREGVLYKRDLDVDAFFVTLRKSEADYSPTTLYRDYPISSTLFHWESQSQTSSASPTGQRYISGSSTKLLFVRLARSSELGTNPYLCAGPVHYVSHSGDRPVAFVWKLDHPLPAEFFAQATVAAS